MDLGQVLFWIIVGGVAGWLASLVMKTDAEMGLLGNIVVGVIGAVVGGFVFSFLGARVNGGWAYSTFVAFIGALILLGTIKMVRRT